MSTLINLPKKATHKDGIIEVVMQSGNIYSFPVADNPRLSVGTHEELNNIELSPFGLHWPDLDEDLSIRGIVDGRFGQASTS